VVVALEGNPTNMDPRFATDAYSTRILSCLFSCLVRLDKSGGLVCDLAESWETLDDRTYVFRLRPGVRFHDQSPLTSTDVKYTFDFLRDPENGSPAAGSLAFLETVEAPDPLTVVFRLREPFAPFLLKLARGVVPAHLAEDREAFLAHPVGSGPFAFEQFRPGEFVRLARWDGYFGDRGEPAPADRVRGALFRVIANQTTRMLAAERGDVDLVQNAIPPYALKFFGRMPQIRVQQEPGVNYQYIGFNLEDPIVGNLQVRRAIAHALDRERIIRFIWKGQARPATGLIAPSIWAYEPEVTTYAYDPDRARELLDRAGFPDPDGDGPRMRFVLSYKTSTDKLRNEIAEVFVEQLRQVGIGVEKRSYEWGTFFSDIKSGNFQMYSLSWVGITDPDILYYIFHSDSMPPRGANRGRYSNPEVDRLLELSRVTLDQHERAGIFSRIQKILAEDCVYVSLWYTDNVVVQKKSLSPFVIYPGGEYLSLAEMRIR